MPQTGESKFTDYYALLGISPGATLPEIRRAFILKAKQHHPDAGGATDIMQSLNAAYRTLMSATAKEAYDMLHNFHSGATELSDYRYQDNRETGNVEDMSDEAIDSFLDTLFDEYRNGPPKSKSPKPTVKQRVKKLFEI